MIAMVVGTALALLALAYVLYPLLAGAKPHGTTSGTSVCPACGTGVESSASFCSNCGSQLPA